ncbi:BQ2448_6161 [Microbotryum intermedium]|uniref:BQ2448_6161 protein n=1 Tax=Microbotryum intermedium TaxID=269621 RepID=A0A238FNI3_9BASI|nr:BQ2448_6161 [Microbotryum intermedium]
MGDSRPYLVDGPGSAVPVWRETITARSDRSELRDSTGPGLLADAGRVAAAAAASPPTYERYQPVFLPNEEGGVSTRLADPTSGRVDAPLLSTGGKRRQSIVLQEAYAIRPSYAASLNQFNGTRDQAHLAYPLQRGDQPYQHQPPQYHAPDMYPTSGPSQRNENGLAQHAHAQLSNAEGGAVRSSNVAHENASSAPLTPASWSSLPSGESFAPSSTLSSGLANNTWDSVTPASYYHSPSNQSHIATHRPAAYYPSAPPHNMRPVFSNDPSYDQPLENLPVHYRPAVGTEQYQSGPLHRQIFFVEANHRAFYPSHQGDSPFGHMTNTAPPRQERVQYEHHPQLMSYPHGMGVQSSSTATVPADDHHRVNYRVNYSDQRAHYDRIDDLSSAGSQFDAIDHLSASSSSRVSDDRRLLKRKDMQASEQSSQSNMDPPLNGLSSLAGTSMAPTISRPEIHESRDPVRAIASDASHLADVLAKAMRMRAELRASPPVLPYNPAREPSASTKPIVQRDGVKYALMTSRSSASTGDGTSRPMKAKQAEVSATCQNCETSIAKLMLRGKDVEFAPQVEFKCLACLLCEVDKRTAETEISVNGQSTARSGPSTQMAVGNSGQAETKVTYADTMSAEIDRMEGRDVAAVVIDPPVEVSRNLPAHIKKQAFTCDICDRMIGAGQITSATMQTLPSFTVEVLCLNCIAKYKPCSDCGGGGGRLTPGRWRCKELFPAGRRTCQLSHARNPPLFDMKFETLSIVDIHPDKLDQLEARCRLVYFDTRLRSTARPEVLETGDSLALTFQEAENQCIDQWNLLSSLLREDIEESRLIRRYVALHSATPHRRRAKSKAKTRDDGTEVCPSSASQPDEEEAPTREKEVTGFSLIEHDLVKGVLFYAVIMPWAVSGEAFEATSILVSNSIRKIQGDLEYLNALRRRQGLAEYPKLSAMWSLTPFQKVSRMSQSVTRRHFMFFHNYLGAHPETDITAFPPFRKTHIPNQFLKAFNIFVRPITYGDEPADISAKDVDHQTRPRLPKRMRPNT